MRNLEDNYMLKFNNIVMKYGGHWLNHTQPSPSNPIPPNTVRVRTSDGNPPVKDEYLTTYETATLVPGTTDVYDVYKSGTSFLDLLMLSTNVVEVIGANTTGITNMYSMFAACSSLTSVSLFDTSDVIYMDYMFDNCTSLTSVPLFNTSKVTSMLHTFYNCTSLTTVPLLDTSNVTDMRETFKNCTSLTSIPLFNTSKAADMISMFQYCNNVQSGALALYNQASSQATPPSQHSNTFHECGSNTTTGLAELEQIPSNWGGRGA
jgi:surface protein